MFTRRDRNAAGAHRFYKALQQLVNPENYATLIRWFLVHHQPIRALTREFLYDGAYPTQFSVRTPQGAIELSVFHPEDLSTLNLVFCREDYIAPRDCRIFVDIGANIGLASAYFLTRNSDSIVYAYEPVPRNVRRLKENLTRFEDRYKLFEVAVSNFRGSSRFGVEPTGKLGSFEQLGDDDIQVDVVHIMDVLDPILQRHEAIGCLKIDAEGHEDTILEAIDEAAWRRVRSLNVDSLNVQARIPDFFSFDRRGSASRYRNQLL